MLVGKEVTMSCCNDNCGMPPGIVPYVVPFAGFTEFTTSVPKLYWNVKSQEQRILALCEQFHKMVCYADMLGDKINEDHLEIGELQALFQKFVESGFDDYYAEQVERWIDEHLAYIYRYTAKQVFFGLTLDGYFVAYIPESWEEIAFDTGADYSSDTYGRLILSYLTDGQPTEQ